MTESNSDQPVNSQPDESADDELLNDPGKSPTDVNKDASAANPVSMTVTDVSQSPRNSDEDDGSDNSDEED